MSRKHRERRERHERRERRRKLKEYSDKEVDEEDPATDASDPTSSGSDSDSDASRIHHSRIPKDERPRCARKCGCMPYFCRELRDCMLALILLYWALNRLSQKYDLEWF